LDARGFSFYDVAAVLQREQAQSGISSINLGLMIGLRLSSPSLAPYCVPPLRGFFFVPIGSATPLRVLMAEKCTSRHGTDVTSMPL
jgi:hypothetical protein